MAAQRRTKSRRPSPAHLERVARALPVVCGRLIMVLLHDLGDVRRRTAQSSISGPGRPASPTSLRIVDRPNAIDPSLGSTLVGIDYLVDAPAPVTDALCRRSGP